jgi:hypothetical protein
MSKKSHTRPDTAPDPKPKDVRAPQQDEQGARTKSSGHRKVTADKWNQ